MSKGKKCDFERTEGEEILSMWNETKKRQGKI